MGLKRRAIAFSGRIPYFVGRFLTIEESSHAGSHGHGGTAAGRGRYPRGPAPLPVRDRGFASFTRFDRALQLDNQIGGGGRIGFWVTDWLGIEGGGLVQRP